MKKGQKISLKEVNALRVLCLKNADELIGEAKLLIENHKYPRALVLSEIAMEELAKIPMLVGYVNRDVNQLPSRKEFSRRWSNHIDKKISSGAFFGIPAKELGAYASAANDYKNFGLYVDLTIKGPMMPRNIIGRGLARGAYTKASIMYKIMRRAEKIIGFIDQEHIKHFRNNKIIAQVNKEKRPEELAKLAESCAKALFD